MKKNHFISIIMVLTVLPGLLVSCQKIHDHVETHPGAEIKPCGISRFICNELYGTYIDTLSVSYNAAGDPIRITRPDPRTGAPNFLFKYKNGRLSEFIGVYHNGTTTENWHRYFYDGAGRVMLDSVYIFAEISNDKPTDPFLTYSTTYLYDSRDRIIRLTNNYPEGSTYVEEYQYDANGNRVGGTYGHEVSFRRSNRIWMFLDRDYSVNDRAVSTDFNAFHLPRKIDLGSASSDVFLGSYFNQATISYLCDARY
jgi:hypothetical protein